MNLKLTPMQQQLFESLPTDDFVEEYQIVNPFHGQYRRAHFDSAIGFFKHQGLIEVKGRYGDIKIRRRTQKEIIEHLQTTK